MNHLNTWATYIVDGFSTIHFPPRIEEFDNTILAPLLSRYFKWHPKQAEAEISSHISESTNLKYNREKVVIYKSKRSRDDLDESSSDYQTPKRAKHKKKRRNTMFEPDVSEIDISAGSLSPFLKWCKERDPGYSGWDNAFRLLREDDVAMDSFGERTTSAKLQSLCSKLKLATADRLSKAHKKWIKDKSNK